MIFWVRKQARPGWLRLFPGPGTPFHCLVGLEDVWLQRLFEVLGLNLA
jgi:hypothetical protein